MKRREFITLIGGVAAAWPLRARAQQGERMRRIGVVMAYAESDANGQVQFKAFREHLQKLGWTEGTNLRIDLRFGAGDPVRIRQLAKELLSLGPDLMVGNSNVVTTILQSEVHTLPLVFVSVSDPIGSGFIADLARPGGNIYRVRQFPGFDGRKMAGKAFGDRATRPARRACLPSGAADFGYLKSAEAAAPPLKIKLEGLPVHSRAEIEQALDTFGREPRGGLIIAPNVVTFANSSLIVALAERYRLPAIYPFAYYAKEGGLISYGFDAVDQFRQGAVYADKILRGAKPSDLPVQHPSKFEIVINLKTARSLGLEFPPTLIALADEVIE
jgi:putative ABC transport system substrate-binding protein